MPSMWSSSMSLWIKPENVWNNICSFSSMCLIRISSIWGLIDGSYCWYLNRPFIGKDVSWVRASLFNFEVVSDDGFRWCQAQHSEQCDGCKGTHHASCPSKSIDTDPLLQPLKDDLFPICKGSFSWLYMSGESNSVFQNLWLWYQQGFVDSALSMDFYFGIFNCMLITFSYVKQKMQSMKTQF